MIIDNVQLTIIAQFLIAIFVGVGLYFISADIFKIPYLRTSRAIKSLSKRQKTSVGSVEIWVQDLAAWLAKFVKINEYKRLQLEADLQTAGMNVSPELYIAGAFVKALFVGIFAVPAFFIFPLATPLLAVVAVGIYFAETKNVKTRISEKRDTICLELPRFVFTVEKTLKHSRDVLSILEKYKESASPEFRHELEITVADMRSSNYESALTRLEARVGSPMLSDVVRGLIGVIRGDETEMYWAALAIKFADIGRLTLKQKVQKVPAKVKRLSMLLLFCFLLLYLVVLSVEIINSLGAVMGG